MIRSRSCSLACLARAFALAAALAVTLAAQTPQAPASPPSVTFQTEVNYVDVDAIVTDEQGAFVSGLTKDDFELSEDGKAQKIDTFSLVEIPFRPQDRFLVLDRPVSSDVRSNAQPFSGRVYVIVLDDLDVSFLRTAQVRKAAREFIERHFGGNDMAAVVYTSGSTEASQEFTSDPRLLLAAIDKFTGRRLRSAAAEQLDALYQQQLSASTGSGDTQSDTAGSANQASRVLQFTEMERTQRAISVLNTLKNLPEFLTSVRGRRKALLMFSEGIDYPIGDAFGRGSNTEILRAVQDAINAAARANVNFFTIDPRGLVGLTSEYLEAASQSLSALPGPGNTDPTGQRAFADEMRLSQDSLRTLAEETGGFAAINQNSLATAFDRIVDNNSRYYLLGYYPPSHPRDGKFHTIQVRVKRPGLKVVARKGYAAPRGKTQEERRRDDEAKRLRDGMKLGADNTSAELREILNSPMQRSGLTFSAQAAPFKGTGKEASVAVAIELDGSLLRFTPQDNNTVFADSIEVSFFGVSDQGKAQRGTRSELNLSLRADNYNRVRALGLRLNSRTALAPGRYQLRIGARDASSGETGSVFYDLLVPDFTREPLMVSGLLLTAPSAMQIVSVQPDPLVAKMLPGAATSRREFFQSDTLSVLAEIYDNIASQQARQIDIGVHLIGENGTEAFTSRDTLQNGSARNWTTYGYTRDIPLATIAPGRYLLRVDAAARGNPNGAKPAATETVITVLK